MVEPLNTDCDRHVESIVEAMTKPTYVWRMARSMTNHPDVRQRNAAVKRMWEAERQINEIMQEVKAGDHEW